MLSDSKLDQRLTRPLSEFTPSRAKESGNKPGKVYKDPQGNEWVIKSIDNLKSASEAFAGALYRLFAGERFIPETCVIIDEEGQLRVGSKIRTGYLNFTDSHENILYDEKHNQSMIMGKPIEGVELISLVSCLLRERDFYGNGNVGFIISTNPSISGFRIDFDDSFSSDRTIGFEKESFLGNLLEKLVADKMLYCFRLLSRENAIKAIEQIGSVSDAALDKTLALYEPLYEKALKLEIEKEEKELQKYQQENNKIFINFYKGEIARLQSEAEKTKLKDIISYIKQTKAQLVKRLDDYRAAPPALPSALPKGYQEVKKFFEIYDGYFTSLHANFSSGAALKLLSALTSKGPESDEYKNYLAMKEKLNTIFNSDKNSLDYQETYLVRLKEWKTQLDQGQVTGWTKEDLNTRIKMTENTIQFYISRVKNNEGMQKHILKGDEVIAEYRDNYKMRVLREERDRILAQTRMLLAKLKKTELQSAELKNADLKKPETSSDSFISATMKFTPASPTENSLKQKAGEHSPTSTLQSTETPTATPSETANKFPNASSSSSTPTKRS